jgi:hypothetical protein
MTVKYLVILVLIGTVELNSAVHYPGRREDPGAGDLRGQFDHPL